MKSTRRVLTIVVNLCLVSLAACDIRIQTERAYSRHADCKMPRSTDDNGIEAYASRIIPEFSKDNQKGFMGTVGVIGGSAENPGAPFFSAIAALKVGADVVHIFCSVEAGDPVKIYSPDIIVQPVYSSEALLLARILPMDVIILGPGLISDPYTLAIIPKIVNLCRINKKPLVIDLHESLLTTAILNTLIKFPPPGIIMTPNVREFEKLYGEMKVSGVASNSHVFVNFDKYGDNLFILRKGCTDTGVSSNPHSSWSLSEGGSAKRSTGQGNLLSGMTGIYFFWATRRIPMNETQHKGSMFPAAVASYSATKLLRSVSRKTFEDRSRSMLTSDMINNFAEIVYDNY